MTVMKKFVVLIFALSFQFAYSQTVIVKQENQKAKGERIYAYATTLDATKEEVNAALLKYMKTFGKARQQDETITVTETILNGQMYPKPLYANAIGGGNNSTAWIGINLQTWGPDSAKVVSQLERWVKEFGVNFYRDKIQVQINEAQRAVEAVDKQQLRTQNENKNIQQRLENNRLEYQQLKKAIQLNRADSVALILKMSDNKKVKDSLTIVSEKVKKALEFQKDRQRKVN